MMLRKLITPIKNIVNGIITPSFCMYCKLFSNNIEVFCYICCEKIKPIVSVDVRITHNTVLKVFALSDYKDPLKKLILAKGSADIIASYQLGKLLSTMPQITLLECNLIVPIPLHWSRYAWRGYNQAEEIAKAIGKRKDVPVVNLLKRVKRTLFQSEIAHFQRPENVKDAFVLSRTAIEKYKNRHILLIDDLMTTGSTLKSAAKELLKLKPKSITAAVVCRVK